MSVVEITRPRDGIVLAVAGALLEPVQVADAALDGLAPGCFLILPQPEVAEYEQHRAADRGRWLAGMTRLRRQTGLPSLTTARTP